MKGDLDPTDGRLGDSSSESMRLLSRSALEDRASAKTLFIPSEKLTLSKLFDEVIPSTSSMGGGLEGTGGGETRSESEESPSPSWLPVLHRDR